ncbi:MAG TPA: hypothetical protein VIE44_17885 [Methylomirabilota bacterium]|jgi:hypothetical protein
MLEPQLIGIGARHLERLVIAPSGALAIWLGYRLFLSMPLAERRTGKLPLSGGSSIFISRVGPGVLFAELQRWIRNGEPDPPPLGIAGGVRAFRGR